MSAVGTLTVAWSHGEDQFCCGAVGTILAIEDKCGAGIAEILRRLETGMWRLNDVRETIRLGLIGGGMAADKAMAAVKLHVDENPNGLAVSVILARAILAAVLVGVPDDPVGKAKAAEAAKQAGVDHLFSTTMAASDAQPSMESVPA